jgi:hypothetical protein
MTVPTMEAMLTDRRFFGLESATPCQRAFCRAAEGRPLGDELSCEPDVVRMFGGADAVATLPVGVLPLRVEKYSGIRTGKSLDAAAASVCMALRVDVSGLRPGETPRIPIIALDTDKARVVLDHIVGTIMAKPALRALLIEDPTRDSIVLRHPSGTPIEIMVTAGARAGGSLVARWLAGVIFDEAPRMLPASEGFTINIEDGLAAVEGRILPGGQIWVIGSPWAPWGECFDSVQNYWGRPSVDRVVAKTPAHTLNPVWWTPGRMASLRLRNERAYRAHVLGEFVDGSAAAFDSEAVLHAYRPRTAEIVDGSRAICFIDAASTGDCRFAWMIGQWVYPGPSTTPYLMKPALDPNPHRATYGQPNGKMVIARSPLGHPIENPDYDAFPPAIFRVIGIGSFDKKERAAISAAGAMDAIVEHARRFTGERRPIIVGDQHQDWALASLAAQRGAKFVGIHLTAQNKRRGIDWLRKLLDEGDLYIESSSGGLQMQRELVGLSQVASSGGGFTWGGKTTDFAMTLVLAGVFDTLGELAGSPHRIDPGERAELGPGDFARS